MKKPGESVVFKSIIGIIIPMILLSVIIGILGYRSFTDGMLKLYEDGAVEIANTAKTEVNGDRVSAYAESEGTTEEYMDVWTELDRLCNSSGATFIYVIQPDLSDYAHITFLFSTINKESKYTKYDFGYVRDTTNDEYKEKYRRLYDGESDSEIVIRDRGYIETDAHITAMVPVKGTDGQTKAILCVQRQMENLTKVRNRFIGFVLLVLAVLVAVIIIAQHFYLHRVLLQPLTKITNEAVRFAAEEVPAETKLTETIKNKDEIGKLAGSIDHMEEQVTKYIDELTTATAEKERISTELSLATRIQADMLPNVFPAFPDRSEFDIYASMKPAKEVGGDFYDFFLIDHDHLGLVMADVSGKGVPAALFMMASKIIIQNIAMTGASPREILETTNNRICIGGMEGVRYKEYEIKLEPGEELFLYTDGVPEATNARNELYGTERMMAILNSNRGLEPEKVLETVKADVDRFVGDAPQFDDLTMLCVRYNGCAPDHREKKQNG